MPAHPFRPSSRTTPCGTVRPDRLPSSRPIGADTPHTQTPAPPLRPLTDWQRFIIAEAAKQELHRLAAARHPATNIGE